MSRTLSVTEPHPSIPRSGGYIGGGRGGAGNYKRYKAEDLTSGPTATGPASRANLIKPLKKRTIAAGRGGAGNMFSEADESIFLFDEEMIKRREHQAPVYHIGRGGAANYVDESKPSTARKDSAASTYSHSSNGSSSGGSTAARRSAERMFGIFGRRGS